jgi:hypothetical protein
MGHLHHVEHSYRWRAYWWPAGGLCCWLSACWWPLLLAVGLMVAIDTHRWWRDEGGGGGGEAAELCTEARVHRELCTRVQSAPEARPRHGRGTAERTRQQSAPEAAEAAERTG